MSDPTFSCVLGARPATIGDLRKLIANIPDDRMIFNDDGKPPAVAIHYSTGSTVLFVDFTTE